MGEGVTCSASWGWVAITGELEQAAGLVFGAHVAGPDGLILQVAAFP